MATTADQGQAGAAATPILFEAIVRKRCVTATYNRSQVTLAPHVVFTRHGDLHVDAVTLERDGKPPREAKIGTFKLAGLGAVRLTGRGFTTSSLFDPADARYEAQTVLAIDP